MRSPAVKKPLHLVIVGSGVAGLYAAITAVEHGHQVTLLTKDALADSNSWYAQGGIAAVGPRGTSRGDEVASHIEDTLTAGARLNDPAAVRAVCSSAWEHIEALIGLGTTFDADPAGDHPALGLEAAHTHPRILHAGGDATGKVIASTLIGVCRRLAGQGSLRILEDAFVTDLVDDDGVITGVHYLQAGQCHRLQADVVLLATGGIGSLYEWTTNPAGATGDGAALAWRAGALVVDAEFVQFHPTLVRAGRFMVSEAVRGEGAVLIDGNGRRFMEEVHPAAELAPRDVVARAIHHVYAMGGQVFLDARAVEAAKGRGYLARRFPSITTRLAALGLDLAVQPVPVTEAQHYWMGGVYADARGRTTVPGLRVAGETACTGTHGANRLASNSLLEALVHGFAAASTLGAADARQASTPIEFEYVFELDGGCRETPAVPLTREGLQDLATAQLGVERTGEGLSQTATTLAGALAGSGAATREEAELRNLITVGRLIAEAALARTTSIGAHYRTDTPDAVTHGPRVRTGFVRAAPTPPPPFTGTGAEDNHLLLTGTPNS
ncbi:L-aspartate oxidase [Arthrobacter rhombi]|uniref:L-aspartate oxidase n=1 Tax=Arthrobacter rhombi TaxID=71253 RepID=UPI003F93BE46